MLTGHEREFRELFAQEAARRLDALVEAALQLDQGGGDETLVRGMFRDAHTLKGSAGVVGFTAVAAVLHELEQELDHLRAGRRPADAAAADLVLDGVDRVRALTAEAMAKADADDERAPASSPDEPPSAPDAVAPAPDPPAGPEAPGEPTAAGPAPGAIPAADHAGAPDPPARLRRLAGPLDAGAIPVPVERVDALVRLAGEASTAHLRLGRLLTERFGVDPLVLDEYRDVQRALGDLQDTALRSRTVALASVAGPLHRAARDLARERGKQVRWELAGEATELDRHVLERLREPLVALVRNAVDHGLETPEERREAGKPPAGLVRVRALRAGAEVLVSVEDDGRGVDAARVGAAAGRTLDQAAAHAAVFEAGVSTAPVVTDVSGRGVGLDAARDAVAAVRGRVTLDSVPGAGTRVTLAVPLTVAVFPALVVAAAGRRWAVPLHAAVSAHGARDTPVIDGEPVAAAPLPDVLGLAPARATAGPTLVLRAGSGAAAIRVDAMVGERDVVVKDLGAVAGRLPLVGGAAVEPDGSVLVLLDPAGLVDGARALIAGSAPVVTRTLARVGPAARRSVLVVDDALTVRELQRSVLERAGYEARLAGDGAEALRVLRDRRPDAVVTDVEMPLMDGVALTAAIRAMPGLERLPVIVLSSLETDADRRRAMAAGADEVLGKSQFEEGALLEALARRLPAGG